MSSEGALTPKLMVFVELSQVLTFLMILPQAIEAFTWVEALMFSSSLFCVMVDSRILLKGASKPDFRGGV